MMNNKKGFGLLWMIIAITILIIVASIVGLIFVNKFVDKIGITNIFIVLGVIVLLVYHKFIISILTSIFQGLKALLK